MQLKSLLLLGLVLTGLKISAQIEKSIELIQRSEEINSTNRSTNSGGCDGCTIFSFPPDFSASCDQFIGPPDFSWIPFCYPLVDLQEEIIPGFCEGDYTIVRTFTLTNECDETLFYQQFITVQDIQAPVFLNVPEDISISESAYPPNLPTNIEGADNCSPTTIFFQGSTTTTIPDGFIEFYNWELWDECGNSSFFTWEVTVLNDSNNCDDCIVTELPNNLSLSCDEVITGPDVSWVPSCFTLLTVSENTFEGDCPNSYTRQYEFLIENECGEQSTYFQIIEVVDTDGPVFIFFPEDLTISGDEYPLNLESPVALDNCDNSVELLYEGFTLETLSSTSFVQTHSWFALDDCGNMTTRHWVITVTEADQFFGCTDTAAANFNPEALFDDGSCQYGTCTGDLDGNNEVNTADLLGFLSNFGCTTPDNCTGDLNGDGTTNSGDLITLLSVFGSTCS